MTVTVNHPQGPWTAVLSQHGDILDNLNGLRPDDEVDISICRWSAMPDEDGILPRAYASGDVIELWDDLYVEDGDPSTNAAARWAQAQAMAAGLNAAGGAA